MGRINNGKEEFAMPPVRVLLVNGDRKYQLELAEMLHNCGYDVIRECSRGSKALDLLREDRNIFDIMMTERMLPDMDGFELLQKVVKEIKLPVIVISSDNDSKDKEKILINGAYYYLVKPISMDILGMVWQNLFRENISKPADELRQPTKRKRVVWTSDLKKTFTDSVTELKNDGEKPTPKMILKRMEDKGIKGLTIANVKSHKQKWEKKPQDKQGGQAFDYNTSIDAAPNLLANNPQNQASQFENDPANSLPDWSNFNPFHYIPGDNNLMMCNNTFHPSSPSDFGLIDLDYIPFDMTIPDDVDFWKFN